MVEGSGMVSPVENGVGHLNVSVTDNDYDDKPAQTFSQDLIAIDNDKFAIYFYCEDIEGGKSFQILLIFTRIRITKAGMEKDESQKSVVTEIEEKLKDLGMFQQEQDLEKLVMVDHDNCPAATAPCVEKVGESYQRCDIN